MLLSPIPVPVETVSAYYSEAGKLNSFPYKKLDDGGKWGPGVWQGGKDWAGIEDRYFAGCVSGACRRATGHARSPLLEAWHTAKGTDNQGKPEDKPEPVPRSLSPHPRSPPPCASMSALRITTT
jgi:hypothetical protein